MYSHKWWCLIVKRFVLYVAWCCLYELYLIILCHIFILYIWFNVFSLCTLQFDPYWINEFNQSYPLFDFNKTVKTISKQDDIAWRPEVRPLTKCQESCQCRCKSTITWCWTPDGQCQRDGKYTWYSILRFLGYISRLSCWVWASGSEWHIPLLAGNFHRSPAISNSNGGQVPVYIKKRDIHKFSRLHKYRPEFKNIWEKLVEPSLPNKTVLATELKASCKEGQTYEESSSISAGLNDTYDQMWASLIITLHLPYLLLWVKCVVLNLCKRKTTMTLLTWSVKLIPYFSNYLCSSRLRWFLAERYQPWCHFPAFNEKGLGRVSL